MLPIFLIGYMGSGKTTLGRGVEARAHISFVDLDQYIEEEYSTSISNLFKERGESGFREIERESLIELSDRKDILIACGGGTPCFFNNMELMNNIGITVWLDASIDVLHARLSEAKSQRPLISNLNDEELREYITESLNKRNIYYSQANHRFVADKLDNIKDLEESIDKFIEKFLQ